MAAIPIREAETTDKTKLVAANQKAIDALPLNSGMWRVEGIPGLYVRCRATSRSFLQQRRVDGVLVKEVLGPLTMKRAKEKAMDRWNAIKPAPAEDNQVGLAAAIEAYIRHRVTMKKMAPKTEHLARYNAEHYLEHWKNRTLDEIGRDRAGIAALHARLTDKHGPATCNQVMHLMSAVYRWHRDRIQDDLPEWPRKVAEIHSIPARDWAYSEPELKAWWHATVKRKDGNVIAQGVSTLGPIKRMWWIVALFTGARKGSIEALRWADVDLGKKLMHFSTAKGGRAYTVPMSDLLTDLLEKYRKSDDVQPSEWVFPSNVIEGAHLGDVKDVLRGVGPAHRLRHTLRTTLAQLGATPDQSHLLMGHALTGVNREYITSSLVVESLRPMANAVAARYIQILGLEAGDGK